MLLNKEESESMHHIVYLHEHRFNEKMLYIIVIKHKINKIIL